MVIIHEIAGMLALVLFICKVIIPYVPRKILYLL